MERMTGNISRFRREEDGAILVLFAIFFAVMLGMVALAFDLGKVASTQTELQSYADSVALAAAGELDGTPGAIARAQVAAEETIQDTQTFGGAADLDFSELELIFLSDIPAKDYNTPADFLAFEVDPLSKNADANARYVWVRFAQPRTVLTVFREAFAATAGFDQAEAASSQVGAEAIAKMTAYTCDVAVMMFCVPPDEVDSNGISVPWQPVDGQSVLLRTGGRNAAWAPGDFGFVDPTDLAPAVGGPCAKEKGFNLVACLIAAGGGLENCIATDGIDLQPGQNNGSESAVFNTRFDIYDSTMNKKSKDPHFGPAPHVISGFDTPPNGCVGQNPTLGDTMPFPPDTCHSSGGCGPFGDRFGDGVWDIDRYIDKNYGNADGVLVAGEAPSHLSASALGASPSRYDVYLAEHYAAISGPTLDPILSGRAETGRPQCNRDNVSPNPERRTIVAAGINCDTDGDGTIDVSGAAKDLKPQMFLRLLMLAPVGKGAVEADGEKFGFWVEVVEKLDAPGGGSFVEAGIYRELVELVK